MLLAIGALFVPAALVEVAAQAIVLYSTPLGYLTDVAGNDSLVSAFVAFLVAGAGYVLAATVVGGGAVGGGIRLAGRPA